jgi:hypothetical protein
MKIGENNFFGAEHKQKKWIKWISVLFSSFHVMLKLTDYPSQQNKHNKQKNVSKQ